MAADDNDQIAPIYHEYLARCEGEENVWAVLRTDGSWTKTRVVATRPTRTFVPVGTLLDLCHTFDVGGGLVKEVVILAGMTVRVLSLEEFEARCA